MTEKKIHQTHFTVGDLPWKNTFVNVLMPYHGNRLSQVKRTLTMLINQTYRYYMVIILVDDAISDETASYFEMISKSSKIQIVTVRKNINPRSPNKALLDGFKLCIPSDYVIITSPEILVPYDAIERMINEGNPDRRNVPILYKLSQKQQKMIDGVAWKYDLNKLKDLPDFWQDENMPGGFFNSEAKQNRTHGGFVGAPYKYWESIEFLPDTEELGQSDSYWHVEELKRDTPAVPIDIEVYHQWHERRDAPQVSVRLQRLRDLE